MSHFEQMMTPALAQWASEIQSHTTSCDLPLLPVTETELDLVSIRSREESQDSLGYNSATSSVLDPNERQRESSLNSVYSDVSTSSVLSTDSLTAKDEETPSLRHRKPFQRVTYSDEQLSALAIKFEEKRYLTTEERHQLASDIGITDTQVKVWFQNRRAKEKRKRYSKDSGLSQSPPNFVTRGVPQAHPSSVIQRNPDYMNSMTSVNCGQMHSLIPQALMHGPLPSLYQNFGTIRQNIAPPQQNYSPYNTFSLPHFYVQMPTSANQQFTSSPVCSPTPSAPVDLSESKFLQSSNSIHLPQTQCQFYPIDLSTSQS